MKLLDQSSLQLWSEMCSSRDLLLPDFFCHRWESHRCAALTMYSRPIEIAMRPSVRGLVDVAEQPLWHS